MRLGTLILEIMGTILMIIGNRDMTFVRRGGGGAGDSRWQYCLLRQHGSNDWVQCQTDNFWI